MDRSMINAANGGALMEKNINYYQTINFHHGKKFSIV